MTAPARRRITLAFLLLLAAGVFLPGINWGLPRAANDAILFGDKKPWTGKEIIALAGGWDDSAGRGADIAANIHAPSTQSIELNATDSQRAEIVRRFRLYSCQPDEMITFRALARMKPARRDYDPRFYQYGGLWVYPVGAMLKIAGACGWVDLRAGPDALAFYLDHPAAFARFYMVARSYSVLWALAGLWIVFALTREWLASEGAAIVAAVLYVALPVVINSAHEAKPHLAGAVLTLLAMWMAMRFLRTGKDRYGIAAGLASGAAWGMVLTGVWAVLVLPVMVLLRPTSWKMRMQTLIGSSCIAVLTFLIANPYLLINVMYHREVLQSNMGNYGNFYRPDLSWPGVLRAAQLLALGGTWPIMLIGICLALAGLIRHRNGTGWVIAAPALAVAGQFVLLARNQPAEYARFALPLILSLVVASVAGLCWIRNWKVRVAVSVLLSVSSGWFGEPYVEAFVADARPGNSREQQAETLQSRLNSIAAPSRTIGIKRDAAPYRLPPIDLFRWRLVLLPRDSTPADFVGIQIDPTDEGRTPLSWANKHFAVTDQAGTR